MSAAAGLQLARRRHQRPTGTIQLSYIYAPKAVPEPGSAPLFAAGLLGLGIAVSAKRPSRRTE